jgi:hypothetical protein
MHALSSIAGLRRVKSILPTETQIANVTVSDTVHSIEHQILKLPWWKVALGKLKSKK